MDTVQGSVVQLKKVQIMPDNSNTLQGFALQMIEQNKQRYIQRIMSLVARQLPSTKVIAL